MKTGLFIGVVALMLVSLLVIGAGCNNSQQNNGTNNNGSGGGNNVCTPDWQCTSWSICQSNSSQTRICNDLNSCEVLTGKPSESRSCTYLPASPVLTTIKIGRASCRERV